MKKSIVLATAAIIGLSGFGATALNTNVQTVSAHPRFSSYSWMAHHWVITKRNIKATLISNHFLTTRHWKVRTKTIPKGTWILVGRGGSDFCPWWIGNKVRGIGKPVTKNHEQWTIQYHSSNWFLTKAEWKKAHRKVHRKSNKKAKTNLNNRDASVTLNNNGGALITKKFSISLNKNDVSVDNGTLKIGFGFANLSKKFISSEDVQNDLNSCVLVTQNGQYLNSTLKTGAVVSLAPNKPVKARYESNQLQNDYDPIAVTFCDPKNGDHLKAVIINLRDIHTPTEEELDK